MPFTEDFEQRHLSRQFELDRITRPRDSVRVSWMHGVQLVPGVQRASLPSTEPHTDFLVPRIDKGPGPGWSFGGSTCEFAGFSVVRALANQKPLEASLRALENEAYQQSTLKTYVTNNSSDQSAPAAEDRVDQARSQVEGENAVTVRAFAPGRHS